MTRQGFTLLELAVATSILIVAASVALLRGTAWGGERELEDSARRLGRVIDYYREKARAEDSRYELTFQEHGYSLYSLPKRHLVMKRLLPEGQSFAKETPCVMVLGPRLYVPEKAVVLEGSGRTLVLRWPAFGGPSILEERR